MERIFVLIANRAVTSSFNLNDLAGSAGRMDIVCRFISQSLFISHGIRKNVMVYAVLKGPPEPCKIVKISGDEVRYLSPDERNIAGMLNKALSKKAEKDWNMVSPGVYVARMDLSSLLDSLGDKNIYYLREDGVDISMIDVSEPVFVIGDHTGVEREDERLLLEKAERVISLGSTLYQADQCVTIINYLFDRVETK